MPMCMDMHMHMHMHMHMDMHMHMHTHLHYLRSVEQVDWKPIAFVGTIRDDGNWHGTFAKIGFLQSRAGIGRRTVSKLGV